LGGGAKYGKRLCNIDPERTRYYFYGFLLCANFEVQSFIGINFSGEVTGEYSGCYAAYC